MKFRQKYVRWIILGVVAFLICVVPWKKVAQKSSHQTPNNNEETTVKVPVAENRSNIDQNVVADSMNNQSATSEDLPEEQENIPISSSLPSSDAENQPITVVSDEYPYNIDEDRKIADLTTVDISVGDRLYMTQINDWYMNFKDYADKTVEIEGYFLDMGGKYTFVGRNGPTCPYCTGGYVDFEFQTDQDLSEYISQETWISVVGILREGKSILSNGEIKPFYYIEAMQVDKMDSTGINPISD